MDKVSRIFRYVLDVVGHVSYDRITSVPSAENWFSWNLVYKLLYYSITGCLTLCLAAQTLCDYLDCRKRYVLKCFRLTNSDNSDQQNRGQQLQRAGYSRRYRRDYDNNNNIVQNRIFKTRLTAQRNVVFSDPNAKMHWTVHITGGPRRVNHAAVAVGPIIYSFGGYCTGEDYSIERPIDIHMLNTVSYRWMQKRIRPTPETPFQRYGHTAVAHGRYVYIWGGRNDESACKTLYRFDTRKEKWERPHVTGDIPGARDGHSAVVMKNKMYIFGGYEEQIQMFSQDVYALDFATMTWSYVRSQGRKPEFRDFHTAIVHQDRYMYVFGGRSDESGPVHTKREFYDNTLVCFDAELQEWLRPKTTGDVPQGRRSHSAFMYEDSMYIFGGYNGVFDKHFADLHRYNTKTGEWTEMKPFGLGPAPRRRQGCILSDDRVFFFGGTSPTVNTDIPIQVEEEDYEDMETLTDHDDMFILDLAPSLKTLTLLKIVEQKIDPGSLPDILRKEIQWMTTPNNIPPALHSG